MTTDADLFATIRSVVNPVVRAAREHGPIPSPRSLEFLVAPRIVQAAALLVCGQARVLEEIDAVETVEAWLGKDYLGGQYHRANHLPLITALDRRRWPPTGDRVTWVRYGPDGPPPNLQGLA